MHGGRNGQQLTYQVGPVRIAAAEWPPAWTEVAEHWFSHGLVPSPILTVFLAGSDLIGPEGRPALHAGEVFEQRRIDENRWRFTSRGYFVADLDERDLSLAIRTPSPAVDPRASLGNALRAALATILPAKLDGVMLHACGCIIGGAGVAVAGLSTAGKTTLSMGLGEATYLSDDVAVVVGVSSSPTLQPSPFYGSAGRLGADVRAPLRAIGILVDKVLGPGARSSFERVPHARAAAELLRHVGRFTTDRQLSERLLELTVALTERVPVVLVKRSLLDHSDDVIRAILAEAGC